MAISERAAAVGAAFAPEHVNLTVHEGLLVVGAHAIPTRARWRDALRLLISRSFDLGRCDGRRARSTALIPMAASHFGATSRCQTRP